MLAVDGREAEPASDPITTTPPVDPDLDPFDVVENEDGSASLKEKESASMDDNEFYENIADILDDPDALVATFEDLIEGDKQAREKRDKQYEEGIRRTGLGNDAPGGADFDGASRVVHPMMAEACVDFAARSVKELFPPNGPVKTKIYGKVTPDKLAKATRKEAHMNRQLTVDIEEYRPSLEQLLTQLPLGGSQFMKFWWSDKLQRPTCEFVPIDHILLPFSALNFYSSDRMTHVQRITDIEYEQRIESGLYRSIDDEIDTEIPQPSAEDFEQTSAELATDKVEGKEMDPYDEDGMREIHEIYCLLDLEEDDKASKKLTYAPYILIIDKATQKILALYRNWEEDDKQQKKLDWIIKWGFIPWRGAYDIGLPQLIGGLSAAATGALRALMDTAHANNSMTGLKLKGAKMGGQSDRIPIGGITEIAAMPGAIEQDIKKLFMPLPFNPPSPVLYELLGFIVTEAKGVIQTALDNVSENNMNTPVGTTLAQIEQGLVVFSAIHARLHDAQRKTLEVLHRINRMYLDDEQEAEELHEIPLATRADYAGPMDVEPVSDPNIFSDLQRVQQNQEAMKLDQLYPGLLNKRALVRRALEQMKVPNIDELMPDPNKPKDENPAAENIKLAMGAPAIALPDQDHLAHLQTHLDFLQNPMFGSNPLLAAQFIPPAIVHILHHMVFEYGKEVMSVIDHALPNGVSVVSVLDDDPGIKQDLSKAIAAASPMVMKNLMNTFGKVLPVLMKAQQQRQQMMQQNQPPLDPATQAQIQIEQQSLQQEGQKNQTDAQLKGQQMQQDAQQTQAQQQLDAQQQQADAQAEQQKQQSAVQLEAMKEQSASDIATQTAAMKFKESVLDNQTALEISELRAETGGSVGGLKNGESIGKEE